MTSHIRNAAQERSVNSVASLISGLENPKRIRHSSTPTNASAGFTGQKYRAILSMVQFRHESVRDPFNILGDSVDEKGMPFTEWQVLANPTYFTDVRHQIRFVINFWCAICSSKLTDPIFYNVTLKDALYLQMSQNVISKFLRICQCLISRVHGFNIAVCLLRHLQWSSTSSRSSGTK